MFLFVVKVIVIVVVVIVGVVKSGKHLMFNLNHCFLGKGTKHLSVKSDD